MNTRPHVLIIVLLLVLEFFIGDIVPVIFLPVVKRHLKQEYEMGTLHERDEYKPSSPEAPEDFEFVLVDRSSHAMTEIYYAATGGRIEITYVDGKWEGTTTSSLPVSVFLFLPSMGFCLVIFAHLYRMARTGGIKMWKVKECPLDNVEKICLLYGIPLFVSAIIFGWLGRP